MGSVLKSLDTEVAWGPLGAGCVHLTQERSIPPGCPCMGKTVMPQPHGVTQTGMWGCLIPCSQYWG